MMVDAGVGVLCVKVPPAPSPADVATVLEMYPNWIRKCEPSGATTLTACPPRIVWDAWAGITRKWRFHRGAFSANGGTFTWNATLAWGLLSSPCWVAKYW